jgi:hypothetical protein
VSLLDRIVPPSALRWGRLTSGVAELLDLTVRRTVVVRFPGGGGARVTRQMCEDAGIDFDELKRREVGP